MESETAGRRVIDGARRRGRFFAAAVVAVLAAGAIVAIRAAHRAPARPNIIFITIDTLRRDHVGAYGYGRGTTPTLDKFAGENITFTNAWANANWTKPSVASIFTGLYVSQHQVKTVMESGDGGPAVTQRLPEEVVTLAEMLEEWGYRNFAVVENVHISEKLGFAQGFRVWRSEYEGARNVTSGFLAELDDTDVQRPFFAYLHYFDPHTPYYRNRIFEGEGAVTPGVFESKTTDLSWSDYTFGVDRGFVGLSPVERDRLVALYDGEIRDVDIGLARVFRRLREKGLYEDAWIIVTADHGENFYENGRVTHPHDCFSNAQVRVPLLMKMPQGMGLEGVVVNEDVQHVDLAPTILSYLGIERAPGMVGLDLREAMRGGALAGRPLIAESEAGAMIVSRGHKLVKVFSRVGDFDFLYDMAADPLERSNLSTGSQETAKRLAGEFAQTNRLAREHLTVERSGGVSLTGEEVEKMKSLGYLN